MPVTAAGLFVRRLNFRRRWSSRRSTRRRIPTTLTKQDEDDELEPELELDPESALPRLRTPRVELGERLVGVALSPAVVLPDPAGRTRV